MAKRWEWLKLKASSIGDNVEHLHIARGDTTWFSSFVKQFDTLLQLLHLLCDPKVRILGNISIEILEVKYSWQLNL
jgi:hypothetical protein